jgi:hypothetical protein
MYSRSYKEQLALLKEWRVPTETWGKVPGTKSLELFKKEIRSRSVILIPHKDGRGLLRVAKRVKACIYYDQAGTYLRLYEAERKFPDGHTSSYTVPPPWSVKETRKRFETTKKAMQRGLKEELRAEPGFVLSVPQSRLIVTSVSEEYEEHKSDHYPGIRTGNFDTSFELILHSSEFRPEYWTKDHGVKLTFKWKKQKD